MTQLERALVRLRADLLQVGVRWALVGGLAVSVRVRPRTTFDIDIAISVGTDRAAEAVVRQLARRGYAIQRTLEQEATGRLAGVRLVAPSEVGFVAIDLLFASSGIEDEVVGDSQPLEVSQGVQLPVARIGHLAALKVLADQPDRPQDRADAIALLAAASPAERERARAGLERIERRGFHRRKDLQRSLRELLDVVDSRDFGSKP